MRNIHSIVSIGIVSVGLGAVPAGAATCESLSGLTLPHTTIAIAQAEPAGSFSPPYGGKIAKVPAFCRVAGTIRPTADSEIQFEVWMPAAGWNEKFLGVGNGGFAGVIGYGSLAGNLNRGYATAGTDTGHEADGSDAAWAYHHPEKVIDFGNRAVHETAEKAKTIIQAFYAKPARHAYFDSCSDGGREALMEAQRFPEDYDGILAGAPANYWSHLLSAGIRASKVLYGDPASYISNVKVPAISAAVLAACDAQDGVKDGIVGDPVGCRFDPAVLLCHGAETRNCLTAPQVTALRKLYEGWRDVHGKQVFPGYMPGGEQSPGGWDEWILGGAPGSGDGARFTQNYFRYMVFEDPNWDALSANPEAAMKAADAKTAGALNSTDPDLSRFHARGGKLILYHGWNDAAIPALNTVNYYESVLATMGANAAGQFVRLYMAPGVQHCIGGPGPSWFGQLGTVTSKGPQHGIYDALEAWVETGAAPGDITATKYMENNSEKAVQMTRPLCAYPGVAKYKGSGDTNDSGNFVCTAPVPTGR